jgi:cystathionine gamma-synthase
MPDSVRGHGADPADGDRSAPTARSTSDAGPVGFETRCVHAGEARQKPSFAITDPIHCTSTYTFATNDDVIEFAKSGGDREEYGRYGNPNEKVLEAKLADLDGGEDSLLFASGMAAITTLLMAKLSAGDEIVFFDECYHRSREFCLKHLSRFGVVTRVVKTGDYRALESAVTSKTRMLVSESPTNPHLSVVDLEAFVRVGRKRGVETLIDATLATPFNLQPLAAGVDYVLHSATKYLGGHNDLLAGVIVGSKAKLESVRNLRGIIGGVNSPHNCYLLQRGLKTFGLRMERHNRNGLALAEFLERHPKIARVWYPGIKSHPFFEVARRTMKGFGGLLTFSVKGDADTASRLINQVTIPRIGPSLGGVESLIEQPLYMSYFSYSPEDRARIGIEDAMIRVAVGIEDTDDLVRDFERALDRI